MHAHTHTTGGVMYPVKLARLFQEELRQRFCKQHD